MSTLLLSQPLALSAIALGRFVLNPLYPDDEFHQPVSPKIPDETTLVKSGDPVSSAEPDADADADVVTHRFENLQNTLDRSRGTRLELSLLELLSFSWHGAERNTKTTVKAPLCLIRQLKNPQAFFRAACQNESVRVWLEAQAQRPRAHLFLVCGFKTLTDARVEQSIQQKSGVEASFSVPAAAIAMAAGVPIPIPLNSGLDVGASLKMEAESDEDLKYTAPGERVYAVQYRKINFSWFSTRKVDKAYLERGNRWKSYIRDRAGESGEEEDVIDAELADPPSMDEFAGTFERFDLDGEEILYEIDEDVEE
jgi:hypothetical protein